MNTEIVKENELFKPKLIANGKRDSEGDVDVFTRNYECDNKYKANKEELAKKYYDNSSFRITNGGTTDKILSQWQNETYTRLFRQLDSDQDNLISCFNINLNGVSKDILKIIDPIIKEMKQENESLNEDEFVKAMYHLYDVTITP
jgi:hypothetical protein